MPETIRRVEFRFQRPRFTVWAPKQPGAVANAPVNNEADLRLDDFERFSRDFNKNGQLDLSS
jgi:hypothetical protein